MSAKDPSIPEPVFSENRTERRNRVLKGASILTGITNSEIVCTIRNMHHHGAELRVAAEARIPSEFLLYVAVDGIAYRCQMIWRQEDKMGVNFLGTEAKPHWHYG